MNESFEHETGTVGINVGFRETDLFKVKGLYANFQIPVRYRFNKSEENKLGETIITGGSLDQTISFFVGYEF